MTKRYELYRKLPYEVISLLCLATLIATEKLDIDADIEDADNYFNEITHCSNCPYRDKCLLCKLEE